MYNKPESGIGAKIESVFGNKISNSQMQMIVNNCAGKSEADVDARLAFIKEECQKTGISGFFSRNKIDDNKLDSVLKAFDDKAIDLQKDPKDLSKDERREAAARIVGQAPNLYTALKEKEGQDLTNRDIVTVAQNLRLELDSANKNLATTQSRDKFIDGLKDGKEALEAMPTTAPTPRKQYVQLPPEPNIQYEILPASQSQTSNIYSSASLATQPQNQQVTYDAAMPNQQNIIYDSSVQVGNPKLPAHLQPNVGQEAALKRAMAEVDKDPITYRQFPNNPGSQQQTTQQQKGSQGQSR